MTTAIEDSSPLTSDKRIWQIAGDPTLVDTISKRYRPFTYIVEADTSDSLPAREDNSTSQQRIPETLEKAIAVLFDSADEEYFEYGYESQFAESLEMFIQRYGITGIEVIQQHIFFEDVNTDVAIEALHTLGRVQHMPSHSERLVLLLRCLFASSARIRCGAALGLAYLDDPKAVSFLQRALEQETSKSAQTCLQRVLEQLEDTQRYA